MDLSLGLEGTHVLVTGAAGHIGFVVVKAFISAGAIVSAFDIKNSGGLLQHERLHWRVVDITQEAELEAAFTAASVDRGVISVCVAVAGLDLSYLPHYESLCDISLEQWERTHRVNNRGTFLTARAWLRGIRSEAVVTTQNLSLIIIGSEAGTFGVPGNADYASSKASIQYGLMKSMAPEAVVIHPRARVNAIAPGPIHTPQFDLDCAADPRALYVEAQATVTMKVPVPMEAVAKCCLFLASESWSGNITGQVLSVDSGKSGRLYWGPDGAPI